MNILAKLRGKTETTDKRREKWLDELAEVKNALDSNEMLFNMTDDFNLTEYAIHKKAALEARYSYLMRLIRKYDEACSQNIYYQETTKDAAEQLSEQKANVEIL